MANFWKPIKTHLLTWLYHSYYIYRAVSSIGWVAGFDQRGTWIESRSLHYKKISLILYKYRSLWLSTAMIGWKLLVLIKKRIPYRKKYPIWHLIILFHITGHERTKRAGTMWGELDRKLEWVKASLNIGIIKLMFFIPDRLILKFSTAEFYFFVKFFDYPFTLL